MSSFENLITIKYYKNKVFCPKLLSVTDIKMPVKLLRSKKSKFFEVAIAYRHFNHRSPRISKRIKRVSIHIILHDGNNIIYINRWRRGYCTTISHVGCLCDVPFGGAACNLPTRQIDIKKYNNQRIAYIFDCTLHKSTNCSQHNSDYQL